MINLVAIGVTILFLFICMVIDVFCLKGNAFFSYFGWIVGLVIGCKIQKYVKTTVYKKDLMKRVKIELEEKEKRNNLLIKLINEGPEKYNDMIELSLYFELELTIKDQIMLTKYIGFDEEIITIPNTYRGKKIIAMSENIFENCKNIRIVTIDADLISIPSNAFKNCINLIDISLPESLQIIYNDSFALCKNLENIYIPNNVTYGYNATPFRYTGIKEFKIPNNIDHISKNFFEGTSLEYIEIPGNIKSIKEKAFYNCKELKKVIICDGVEKIEKHAFLNCSKLKEIVIPKSMNMVSADAFNLVDIYQPDRRYNPVSYEKENENLTIYCHHYSGIPSQFRGKIRCKCIN